MDKRGGKDNRQDLIEANWWRWRWRRKRWWWVYVDHQHQHSCWAKQFGQLIKLKSTWMDAARIGVGQSTIMNIYYLHFTLHRVFLVFALPDSGYAGDGFGFDFFPPSFYSAKLFTMRMLVVTRWDIFFILLIIVASINNLITHSLWPVLFYCY